MREMNTFLREIAFELSEISSGSREPLTQSRLEKISFRLMQAADRFPTPDPAIGS